MYLAQFIYNGGSHPGSVRKVVTNEIILKERLSGFDLEQKELRSFKYDKIEKLIKIPLNKYDRLKKDNEITEDLLILLEDAIFNGTSEEKSLANSIKQLLSKLGLKDYIVYFDGEWSCFWYSLDDAEALAITNEEKNLEKYIKDTSQYLKTSQELSWKTPVPMTST